MAIELVPLCTLQVQLKPPIEVGAGCAGTRVIVEVASVQVKGDRLRAEMAGGAAADWLLIGPEGTGRLTSGRRFAPMTARDGAGQRHGGHRPGGGYRGAVTVSGATVLTAPWADPDTSGFIAFCHANDCVFAFTGAESAALSATVADARH